MITKEDLVQYQKFKKIVDKLEWVIVGEAVIEMALLKQWFINFEQKIAWGIEMSKPKAKMITQGQPCPITPKKKGKKK